MSAAEHTPAQLALLRIMEQLSEEHWAAGWYSGLERILWRWMHLCTEGPLSAEDRAVLRWLAEQAGGWWHWPKGEPEPLFVSLDRWQRLCASMETSDGIRLDP